MVVRGSGTGLVGACVPIYGGIMLETTLMNHILELDTENLTVTVEPGVLLMELSKFVEENDLFYPPDPGEKSATIAGNISTNAGGMRAVKYGVTRDYVRGLTVVMPNGEVLELGGKIVKNSSGYSLKDLVIGSEGTLCVITRAVLKLLPLPKKTLSLLVPFDTFTEAAAVVPKIIKSKAIPTAIEFMERQTILFAEDFLGKKFPDTKSNAYILLTFDGNKMCIRDSMSYVECPDCGKKIAVFGESHIDEVAADKGLKVLAKLPIDPETASLVDAGNIEDFKGNWLDSAADVVAAL